MIILKPEEMRRVDEAAIQAGFPDQILMETAGRGVAEKAREIVHNHSNHDKVINKNIIVAAGKGNNGGDGLVAARYLDIWGYKVKIILLADKNELSGSPAVNYKLCRLRNIDIIQIDRNNINKIDSLFNKFDLVVDAILGTGIKGEVREPAASLIDFINNSSKKVLAVDIPSGVSGENGKILGKAIKADYTVTMAYPKIGLLLYPGRSYCGLTEIVDLGVPEKFAEEVKPEHYLLEKDQAAPLLPQRPETAHKGTFGKVGVIGGSAGMSGAPGLTATAALRMGAGLVRTAVPAEIKEIVAGYSAEIINVRLNGSWDSIEAEDMKTLEEMMVNSTVMAAGPGLGRGEGVALIIDKVVREFDKPLVLDADGLNALDPEILKERSAPVILTPHPGEMARLLKTRMGDVQKNRVATARKFAVTYQVYLILKGAATIIALPDSRVYINPSGNEGMATGGSGDVLTGILAGLLAQGLKAEEASVLAPYLHGVCGDLATEELGSYSVIAGDLISSIPEAIKYIME